MSAKPKSAGNRSHHISILLGPDLKSADTSQPAGSTIASETNNIASPRSSPEPARDNNPSALRHSLKRKPLPKKLYRPAVELLLSDGSASEMSQGTTSRTTRKDKVSSRRAVTNAEGQATMPATPVIGSEGGGNPPRASSKTKAMMGVMQTRKPSALTGAPVEMPAAPATGITNSSSTFQRPTGGSSQFPEHRQPLDLGKEVREKQRRPPASPPWPMGRAATEPPMLISTGQATGRAPPAMPKSLRSKSQTAGSRIVSDSQDGPSRLESHKPSPDQPSQRTFRDPDEGASSSSIQKLPTPLLPAVGPPGRASPPTSPRTRKALTLSMAKSMRKPSKPSKSSKPSKPFKSSKPSKPSKSSKPSKPSKPSKRPKRASSTSSSSSSPQRKPNRPGNMALPVELASNQEP